MLNFQFLNNNGNTAEDTSGGKPTKAEILTEVNEAFTELANFASLVTVYNVNSFDYDDQQSEGAAVSSDVTALVTGLNRAEGEATVSGEKRAYIKYRDLGFTPEPLKTRVNYKGDEYRVTGVRNPFDSDAIYIIDLVPL